MTRFAALVLALLTCSALSASAQNEAARDVAPPTEETLEEAAPVPPPPAAQPTAAEPAADDGAERAAHALAPKVVVVVAGDPDDALRAAAAQLEEQLAMSGAVRLPSDENLRGALRGATGSPGDGLDEVRRERQRLGLSETEDAQTLQRLGRRAGAVLVVVVQTSPSGAAEAVALDVRSGQFFEGAQALADADAARATRFVARRAATASEGAAPAPQSPPEAAPTAAPGAAATAAEESHDDVGHWFEQNWAYFAAGGLLVAAIVFVAVTASDDGDPPPVLRFQPGSR